MESPFKKEDSRKKARSQVLNIYHIKKALLNKAGRRCARCYRKTVPVRLARVRQKKGLLVENGYCLLCHDCITERQEKRKEKKKRLWRRKASRRKNTKGSFLNKVRKKILERDGYTCLWCDSKENIGLGSLIPESRGGKRSIENYVACCGHCRPSKGSMLPLEYLWKDIDVDEYLHQELDEQLRVFEDPGKYVQIRFFLFSELSEFLHRLTNEASIPSRTRSRAELLNIKLLS